MLILGLIISLGMLGCTEREKDKEIKIGAIIPLTGYAARYGQWIQEALELIKDEVNEDGGIKGRKLEIIYEDDQANPSKAANAMNKLANIDKVPAVIGSWASSCVLAQAPIANRTKTIIMALGASPKIRDAGDYVFRAAPDARLPLAILLPYIISREDSVISILYINNDFGKDQAEVFRRGFENLGGKITLFEGYDGKSTDFKTVLTKLKGLKFDGVFVVGYAEVGIILKQAMELGIKSHFYSSFPFENTDILKTAGNAAEGVIYPHFFNPKSDVGEMKEYQQKYIKKYARQSEGFAAEAYNGMFVIISVMKEVGFSPEDIKDRLYQIKDFPGLFGKISFDENGDINMPMLIKTVRSGEFTLIAD
jgi:branched-chain amino acid transport system substrate-binding protein